MPSGDRTGPRGFGARTGRGLGYCTGNEVPGSDYRPGSGYGRGRGIGLGYRRGRGFGRGRAYREPMYLPPHRVVPFTTLHVSRVPLEPSDKLAMLKQEKDYLESEFKGIGNALEDISKSIEELEKKE